MNTEAPEFIPQRKQVDEQVQNMLSLLILDFFNSPASDSDNRASKIALLLSRRRKVAEGIVQPAPVDPNPFLAKTLVACSLCECGRAAAGVDLIRRLSKKLENEAYHLFVRHVQDNLYFYSHSDSVKTVLRSMSEGKRLEASATKSLSDLDVASIDSWPVVVVELIHLQLHLIHDLFQAVPRPLSELSLLPSQTCMDFCYLANTSFQLQLDQSRNAQRNGPISQAPVDKTDKAAMREHRAQMQAANDWLDLLCLICESMCKLVCPIASVLMCANESVLNGAWAQSVDLSHRQAVLNARIAESGLFSASNLSAQFEGALTRLRELLVRPDGLSKMHVRSAALDVLLTVASVNSGPRSPSDLETDESAGTPSAALDDDYTEELEKFLQSIDGDPGH